MAERLGRDEVRDLVESIPQNRHPRFGAVTQDERLRKTEEDLPGQLRRPLGHQNGRPAIDGRRLLQATLHLPDGGHLLQDDRLLAAIAEFFAPAIRFVQHFDCVIELGQVGVGHREVRGRRDAPLRIAHAQLEPKRPPVVLLCL